jgi:TRAP-type mannitol/chloroaromatic compound transport system permease small subunit
MSSALPADAARAPASSGDWTRAIILCRSFAWCTIAALCVYLLNNYLSYWRGWPGPASGFEGSATAYALIQLALYPLGLAAAVGYVLQTRKRPLRPDAATIYGVTAYIVRAAFWAVLLIGIADTVVSFMRVEGLLRQMFGEQVAVDLGRPSFRGAWVHFPMAIAGIVIAAFNRGIGFHWLALLVVIAEMVIVIGRFIFSYEQAFMADLVRFWYAPLFLFSSAYTLLEEGHVRVDILYSAFSERAKGIADAAGSVLLGMSVCWVVLIYGMGGRSSIINAPLLSFEVTQTGFGMYVKYWMAAFLAIFAATMLLQFSGYFLEAMANVRGEPGKRQLSTGTPDDA